MGEPERTSIKPVHALVGCLIALLSCTSDGGRRAIKPVKTAAPANGGATVLFEDAMLKDWQENWFLDGKRAVLGHTVEGLWIYCTPSGVDKRVDRAKFDAHHAVLWTKQEFEGDVRITYDFARRGTSLLYVQAQGIGTPPYGKDIYSWRELREVASMDKYFTFMTLRSLSFRENVRFRRYPWRPPSAVGSEDNYENMLVKPMIEYETAAGRMDLERFSHVLVESRRDSLRLRIQDAAQPEKVIEHVWDARSGMDPRQPVFTRKGRIGLRNMGGGWARYANFKVERL